MRTAPKCIFCKLVEDQKVVQMSRTSDGGFDVARECPAAPKDGDLWLCPRCWEIMILRTGAWAPAEDAEIAKLPREVVERIERKRAQRH
jgi:hypothetical protein